MASDNIDLTGQSVLDEFFPSDGVAPTEVPVAVLENETPVETPAPAEETPTETPAPKVEDKTGKAEEKPVVEGETHVPIAVVRDLRADKRSIQQQLVTEQIARARAEARAEVLAEMVKNGGGKPKAEDEAKVEEGGDESPLERFSKEFPDEAVPARVLLDQRRWDNERAVQEATQVKTQTLAQQVEASITEAKVRLADEKVGEGLGIDSVVGLARQSGLLSEADNDYAAKQGSKAADTLYNLAIFKIRQAGGVAAQELNRRVIAARATRSSAPVTPNAPKPKTNTNKTPAQPGKTPVDQLGGDQENSDITNFLFS